MSKRLLLKQSRLCSQAAHLMKPEHNCSFSCLCLIIDFIGHKQGTSLGAMMAGDLGDAIQDAQSVLGAKRLEVVLLLSARFEDRASRNDVTTARPLLGVIRD